jgi:hypothetical protein
MSWLDILNKNDNEFETTFREEEILENDVDEIDPKILNVDDEFDHYYGVNICDIKFDFKLLIEENDLPFLDKLLFDFNNNNGYDFYDFIKYNSKNYYDLLEKINDENEQYLKQNEDDFIDDDYDEEYYEKY